MEVIQLCYGISKSSISLISPLLYPKNPNAISLLFLFGSNLFALILLSLCYHSILKYFTFLKAENNQYILMTLTPLLMIFMSSEYINNSIYTNTIVMDSKGTVLNANHFQMLALQCFGLFSLFCIVYAYRKLLDNIQVQTKLSMLEQEIQFQTQYVEEAKLRYEKTKSFRHDLKNHLSIIYGFIEKGNVKEAKRYLQSVETLTQDFSFPYHTNNPVLDILIGNKLGLARSMGIEISCSLELPNSCSVSDMDFCIILSNALDNAIHACENVCQTIHKSIQLSGHRHGDFFLIEIQNSFSGKPYYKKGQGFSNMEAIIEKHNGTININLNNNMFTLDILLIISQQSKCISQQSD